MDCSMEICSDVVHRVQGDNLLHHGLLHGLQGKFCTGTWSTSNPPSSLTFVSARLFLTFSHPSLPAVVAQQFFFYFPFLNLLFQSPNQSFSLSWSGQQWVTLEQLELALV